MHFRVCIALLLYLSACASAPVSSSITRSSPFAPPPASRARIQLVSARTDSRQSPIAKADLERARALLFEARNDLEPRQWEALAGKLTAAEQAFDRFSQATKASGQTVQVVRAEKGLAQVDRLKAWVKKFSRVGSMLVCLVLLYPASTAGPEIDRRPGWVDAQREYEARLREVAEESQRLMDGFERQEAEEVVPDFDSDPVAAVKAPTSWRTETNPATGKPYTSMEEYDRIPRYPNQTCKNSLLDKLEAEKDQLTNEIPRYNPNVPNTKNKKKLDKVPCSKIRLRLDSVKKVLEKRREIQKKCFGDKPDPGHNTAMTQLEDGVADIKALEAKNCAPGHPMSEL